MRHILSDKFLSGNIKFSKDSIAIIDTDLNITIKSSSEFKIEYILNHFEPGCNKIILNTSNITRCLQLFDGFVNIEFSDSVKIYNDKIECKINVDCHCDTITLKYPAIQLLNFI